MLDSTFGNLPNKKEKRNSLQPFIDGYKKRTSIKSCHPKDKAENILPPH